MSAQGPQSYQDVNARLRQIIDQVADDALPMDDALDLFEEAVDLGMRASALMEEDIAARGAQQDEADAGSAAK